MKNRIYIGKTIGSFIIILLLMPIGHATMGIMEHNLSPTLLHYSAFTMGLIGLIIVITGIYVKGDTKQTLYGITGAMLFWTGWVEFLFLYYAQRYGAHCDLLGTGIVQTTSTYVDGICTQHDFIINGKPLEEYTRPELKHIRGSRPEYLIMSATFGLWVMVMTMYLFCTKTGCNLINWLQKHLILRYSETTATILRPMAHHSSIITFMEWNVMMWGIYIILMFCYDPVFLGPQHPITIVLAAVCLIGAILMLKKQLHISQWGRNIRFALATVIIFWTFVEICGRNGFFTEIWNDPMNHPVHMLIILLTFITVIAVTLFLSKFISTSDDSEEQA